MDVIPASPSKYAARHQRSSCTPTSAACEAALKLLKAYANSPQSLLHALPNYGLSDLPGLGNPHTNNDDDCEPEMAHFSRRVREAKNCWELLREGFVKRDSPGVDGMSSNYRRSKRGRHNDWSDEEDESFMVPAPVDQQAWPVLEWLLKMFEKDEAAVAARGQPRFSPLLLSQIPPSRSASGSRWEVEAPLDVAFYSLQQRGRYVLGIRLLALLVNLTATVFVDLPMITNAVCARTLGLTEKQLEILFSLLPVSQTANHFKVSLCKLCLADTLAGSRRARPKPQARIGPRPTPRQRGANAKAGADESATSGTNAEPETMRRTFFTPPTADILELLRGPSSSRASSADITCQLKFQLVSAFAGLQDQLDSDEQDPAWREARESGELAKAVDAAFAYAQSPGELTLVQNLKYTLEVAEIYR
ncbi:uncharacterized protein PHACADRAFT_97489 [Phanerochaete carnosa HHB-10118-sp]|uniref:Uncharacterized protein n=1 Tax=Phanerochaete carnosa (strain HHB-10118-sp) TaxID=650164 RepID=K5UWQ0_PHACS|nr:uncharacterized protein PHACADRAFT_97489 [Phanerochaete carnosa HHB-10118-sp]EKM54481.1 hypothetical protein PHACADRAFT_97489 [Phanerochaete carnosa HHB-10118-sp]